MDNKNTKICFFCPHRQRLGGGLLMFLRLAKKAAEDSIQQIFHVDYKLSNIRKYFSNSKIKYLNYEDDCQELDENTIFFVYINMLPLLLSKFGHLKKARIFIINFHIESPKWTLSLFNLNNLPRINAFMKCLRDNNSIVFMDEEHRISTNILSDIEFDKKYVPIFIDELHEKITPRKIINKNEINIGFLSRLDKDKIWQLINLLDNLYRFETEKKIKVHIVGDGNAKNIINTNYYSSKMDLIFNSYLFGDELINYFTNNVDFVVSAGTSCLDIGAMKLPSVIVPYKMAKFNTDIYTFLFDHQEYFVGGRIEKFEELNIPKYTISEIISMIYKENTKMDFGNRCYEYVKDNHYVDEAYQLFKKYIYQSTLTMEKILSISEIATIINNFKIANKYGYGFDAFRKIKYFKNKFIFKLSFYKRIIQNKIKSYRSETKINKNYEGRSSFFLFNIFPLYIRERYNNQDYIKLFGIIPFLRIRNKNNNDRFYLFYHLYLMKIKKENNVFGLYLFGVNIFKFAKKQVNEFDNISESYKFALKNIRKRVTEGKKVRVAFYVCYDRSFVAESILLSMLNDNMFDPFILIVPDVSRGKENMLKVFDESVETISKKYSDIMYLGYDKEKDEYLDFSDKSDIVFFATPYSIMTHPKHFIENFFNKGVLTTYVNYGFFTLKFGRKIAGNNFYSYLWKVFIDSKENYDDLKICQKIKGKNAVISGFCRADNYFQYENYKKDTNRKCIIIAPHHTVGKYIKSLDISNFIEYSDFFLKLPEMYPEIDFIFRPHVLLLFALSKPEIWGKEKAEAYYEKIKSFPNVIYDTSADYFETFAKSDAIIHDCGSFVAEYLFANKPCCYILRKESSIKDLFLPIGEKCLDHYYKAFNEDDITDFINRVVIDDDDTMKESRASFSKYLKLNYPHVSEYIKEYIKREILG